VCVCACVFEQGHKVQRWQLHTLGGAYTSDVWLRRVHTCSLVSMGAMRRLKKSSNMADKSMQAL
jgi:hypothetical protein